MTEYVPRVPTDEELEALVEYLREDHGFPYEKDHFDGVYMAVFDPYMTDSPGYVGKVLVALFGSETMFSAFRWYDVPKTPGKDERPYGWSRIHQEEGF